MKRDFYNGRRVPNATGGVAIGLTKLSDNELSAALRLWQYKQGGAASNAHYDQAAKMVKRINRELNRRFPERSQ